MPRLTRTTPKYRRHKASGQAVVTIEGRDHYLGPWRTKASTVEYDRLIGEWLARGRPDTAQGAIDEITIKELIAAYWTFAKTHYRKAGKPTSELGLISLTMRPLARLYGVSTANRFGPLSLKAVRQTFIDSNISRGVVNANVGRIKRCFRWGVENELVSPTVFHGLQAVRGLQ